MNVRNLVLGAAIAIGLSPMAAWSQPQRDREEKILKLTASQKQQLLQMRQREKPAQERQRELLQRADSLYQEITDGMGQEVPPSEILRKFDEMQRLRQEAARLQFERLLEMREILTPEQRQRMAAMISRRRPSHP
ncbi:MAG: Spy/CpxP family protein refolding chaperone [Pseudanabaenaceae cyanobacterium]